MQFFEFTCLLSRDAEVYNVADIKFSNTFYYYIYAFGRHLSKVILIAFRYAYLSVHACYCVILLHFSVHACSIMFYFVIRSYIVQAAALDKTQDKKNDL